MTRFMQIRQAREQVQYLDAMALPLVDVEAFLALTHFLLFSYQELPFDLRAALEKHPAWQYLHQDIST